MLQRTQIKRNSSPDPLGLGVFIINTQQQLTISMYIKATMPSSTSVIMAEAAAFALAASLISAMHMQAPIYHRQSAIGEFLQ